MIVFAQQCIIAILKMSLTGFIVFLFVLPVRLVVGKISSQCSCILWMAVLFRLLVPFSIQFVLSPWNLFPLQKELTLLSVSSTGILSLVKEESFKSVFLILFWVWVAGVVVISLYHTISFAKVKKSIKCAFRLKDNIFLVDHINTAFVLGLLKPKIYVPSTAETEDRYYMILHEQGHIKRGDHIVIILATIAVTIHWFNPSSWIMYVLLNKDLELGCDARVIKKIGLSCAKAYASTLLQWSVRGKIIPGNYKELGGGSLKSRIKHICTFRTPKKGVLIIGVTLCLLIVCACSTNAANNSKKTNNNGTKIIEINGKRIYFLDGIEPKDLDQNFLSLLENHSIQKDFWAMGNGTLMIKESDNVVCTKKGE